MMKTQQEKLAEELAGMNFKPRLNHNYPIRSPRKPLYPGPNYRKCAGVGLGAGRGRAALTCLQAHRAQGAGGAATRRGDEGGDFQAGPDTDGGLGGWEAVRGPDPEAGGPPAALCA